MQFPTLSRRSALLVVAVALVGVAPACSDDGGSQDAAPTTTAAVGAEDQDESVDGTEVDPIPNGTDDTVAAPAPDSIIEVMVAGGAVSGDAGRREVAVGDTVVVRVTSDQADEVHVHGYDNTAAVALGEPVEIQFVADIPGVFEIELESAGLLLAELEVS